ncbi:hypothetical protein AX17_005655 [Amanita inopinata Kibby_2008]|nr:hypothetical protein AX17_005655 [Amanita inopinata Kibby_2008]
MYDVAANASLSEQPRVMHGGLGTWTINFIPGQDAILSADPFIGYDIFNLTAFAANSSTRATEVYVAGQQAICWCQRSPKTGHYYLADPALARLYEVEVG